MFNEYVKDVKKYLLAKFPHIHTSTVDEVSEYICNRSIRLVHEAIMERDKLWRLKMKK
jgi:hypothetical protein